MKQKLNQPPNTKEWRSLPFYIKVYIGWIIFKSAHWKPFEKSFVKKIQRIDLWFIPPLTMIGTFTSISKIVPKNHPMAFITSMATSLMGMTLSLFIIRPPKKKTAHWVQ